jgi:hypothetical protein
MLAKRGSVFFIARAVERSVAFPVVAWDRACESSGQPTETGVVFWTWSQPWVLSRMSFPVTVGRQVGVPVELQPEAGIGLESAEVTRVWNRPFASWA